MGLIISILTFRAVIRRCHTLIGLVIAPQIGPTVWHTDIIGIPGKLILRALGLTNTIVIGV